MSSSGFLYGSGAGATLGGDTGGILGGRPETYWIELEDGTGDTLKLEGIKSINPVREHSALSDWQATVEYSPWLEGWRFAEIRIYQSGEFVFRGELKTIHSDEDAATTTISGPGIGVKLQESGDAVKYQGILGWKAIEDYYANHFPYTGTITEPSSSAITGESVQEASTTAELKDILTPAATDPVEIAGDEVHTLPTCHLAEGETEGNVVTDANFSDGEAGSLGAGLSFDFNFTVGYDIPETSVGVAYRGKVPSDGNHISFDIEVNGNVIESIPADALTSGLDWDTWQASSGDLGGDLQAGTHTVTLRATGGSGNIDMDVVVLYDTRFNYNFDNTVDGNQALSGPEPYPDAVTVNFAVAETPYNITDGHIISTWDDVTGSQSIALSADGGSSYTSASNSQTLDVDFGSPETSTIEGRATLSRYTSGSPTSTPTSGNAGQSITSWEIQIDGDDLAVFEDMAFEGDHLKNLQKMHQAAGMRFVIKHDPAAIEVESFAAGDVVKQASWDVINRKRKVDVSGYANKVVGLGAKLDDTTGIDAANLTPDGRLTDEIQDDAEIAAQDGRVVETWLTDPSLDTLADLRSAIRTELVASVDEDSLTGSLDIVPQLIDPGYSYNIPDWGVTLPLEKVEYAEEFGRATGSLSFESLDGIDTELTGVKVDTAKVGERV